MKNYIYKYLLLIVMFSCSINVICSQEITCRKIVLNKLIGESAVKGFNKKIYDAAVQKKIKIYRDYKFKHSFKIKEGAAEFKIEVTADPKYPDYTYDSAVNIDFSVADINGYQIRETWSFSPDTKEYTLKLTGIALNYSPIVEGYEPKDHALFWIPFDNLSKIISDVELNTLVFAIFDTTKKQHSLK